MAINPGDSRLPLYLDGTVNPVWRKLSPCKSVGLYLLHRDYWSHFKIEEGGRKKAESVNPPECILNSEVTWKPGFRPDHNGIIEGIAHVCPWMVKYGSRVYVEVLAKYRINQTELDAFDFENDDVIFSLRTTLNPPLCSNLGPECFAEPPKNLHCYSAELRQLYEKLGGPCASKPLKYENLTSSGVLPGKAFNNRMEHTFVPPTEATKCTDCPDLPYVTYNFPFRFDINSGPDSIVIRSNRPTPTGNHPLPKNRRELYYDAIYGFNESDETHLKARISPEFEDSLPRIRHPREPVRSNQGIGEIERKVQSLKYCFHADSYPWRRRRKVRPKAGIYWSVRVYAVKLNGVKPESKDLAELTIRKLTFLPTNTPIMYKPPPQICVDYCLAIGPKEGTDAGVITLVARLDKIFYTPGDPVDVNIKIHNTSSRVVQQLTVEVIQCVRISTICNRAWRSSICKREITANSEAEMPILPGTERLRLRCRLNPWPVETQQNHTFHEKSLPPCAPAEAYKVYLPTESGIIYGAQQVGRYEELSQRLVGRRKPAFSTLRGIVEKILTENSSISVEDPESPFVNYLDHQCRCVKHNAEVNEVKQCSHNSPEPYQYPVFNKDEISGEDQRKYQIAVQQMLAPLCAHCGKTSEKAQPIYINYEVVVSAILRPQNLDDPLAQDALLINYQLNSGLEDSPKGEILGTMGPRVVLPAIFAVSTPQPELTVPVSNSNVDQRQERPLKIPPKAQVWEPTDGRGFFFVKEPRKMAMCNATDQTMPS